MKIIKLEKCNLDYDLFKQLFKILKFKNIIELNFDCNIIDDKTWILLYQSFYEPSHLSLKSIKINGKEHSQKSFVNLLKDITFINLEKIIITNNYYVDAENHDILNLNILKPSEKVCKLLELILNRTDTI